MENLFGKMNFQLNKYLKVEKYMPNRLLIVVLISFSIVGCSNVSTIKIAEPDKYAAAQSQFPNQATVYIFRGASKAAQIWPFPVSLDGKKIGTVRREQYLIFPASAGKHLIGMTCPSICEVPSILADVDLSEGKSYYFMIEPIINHGYNTITMFSTLKQVDKKFAENLIETYTLGKSTAP